MRNPIPLIRICTDSPRLVINVSTNGCDQQELMEKGELIIHRDICEDRFECKEEVNDCGVRYVTRVPAPSMTLTYPALGFAPEGGVEFYLDQKFYNWGAGRYKATLHILNTSIRIDLRIELCTDAYHISNVSSPEGNRGCL